MNVNDLFPEAPAAELDLWISADGWGGEGVDYIGAGETEVSEILYRLIRGHWILTQTDAHGVAAHTVYNTEGEAEAAYRGTIDELHRQGVEFQPDTCPIFDEIEATWK